ncbi:hypothetical protein [Actinomadura rubrisoli]|uniref:Uncharacterized protein n=1 Tax=Actinomadura rubrisoli TaxID=2530368 RepID=A0A4R5ASN9_9ACTN|nr:hypothetical protein [Actinomadura rubrisoli]TDD74839.1 hypothetical protein E1298_32100 [Actinomadura rubrisoli]
MLTSTPGAAAIVPPARRGLSPWPARHCPNCETPLDGGPVQFRCPACQRGVHAADIDHEHRPAPAPTTQPEHGH